MEKDKLQIVEIITFIGVDIKALLYLSEEPFFMAFPMLL
jgi:hypothetical protein